jgi:hypothetical protein
VEHDDIDREAGRRIECPVLVLWATRGGLPRFYRDVLDVWRPWAGDVRAPDAKHFLAKDRPEESADQRCGPFSGSSSPTTSPPIALRWRIAATLHGSATSASPSPT